MPSRSPPCRVLTQQLAFRPTPPLYRVETRNGGLLSPAEALVLSFNAKVVFPTNDRTRKGRAEEHAKEQRAGVRSMPAILIRFYFIY